MSIIVVFLYALVVVLSLLLGDRLTKLACASLAAILLAAAAACLWQFKIFPFNC